MFRNGIRLLVFTTLVFIIFYHVGGSVDIVDLCVDPGHGGNQPGTLTHIAEYPEKCVNLDVALALKDTLDWYLFGPNVIYTRLTDTTIDLAVRPDIANAADALSFISIHHSAGGADWFQPTSLIRQMP